MNVNDGEGSIWKELVVTFLKVYPHVSEWRGEASGGAIFGPKIEIYNSRMWSTNHRTVIYDKMMVQIVLQYIDI
jgi:hypothetical protein